MYIIQVSMGRRSRSPAEAAGPLGITGLKMGRGRCGKMPHICGNPYILVIPSKPLKQRGMMYCQARTAQEKWDKWEKFRPPDFAP
jgi:hypothetical protein